MLDRYRQTKWGDFKPEAGQALVFVVLLLAVLVGMAAMVLDVGHWFVTDRKAQTAADAGALAAAWDLPENQTGAQATGAEYVAKNQAGATATVRPAFGGSPYKVEVKVGKEAETFFAGIFGIRSVTVRARAVAQIQAGKAPLAIFNNSTSCSQASRLNENGDNFTVEGGVHSNGAVGFNGNGIVTGSATYSGDCVPSLSGSPMDFGYGQTKPVRSRGTEPWPAYFEASWFNCTYRADKFEFKQEGQKIPSGVYCANQRFTANGKNQTGQITVIAPVIEINGEGQNFTPYEKNVLFFSTGSQDMILDGKGYSWQGIIFHPGGRVKINGDDQSVFNGLIEAQTVLINGQGLRIIGDPGSMKSPMVISLVE